jgi:hypothetical protein
VSAFACSQAVNVSPVTWIVIAFIGLACVLGVIATIVVVSTHLKHLGGTLRTVREEVEPELERLRVAAEVTRAELDRVGDAADELSASRHD